MKSYAKNFDESDSITPRGNKARKVANRRESKKQIQQLIREDEEIGEERIIEEAERKEYFEENYRDFEEYQEENYQKQFFLSYTTEEIDEHLGVDWCPCCGR